MLGFIAIVLPRADGGYRIEFPDLPGCRGKASCTEEALARAPHVLATWLAAAARAGAALPLPRPSVELGAEMTRLDALAGACIVPAKRRPPVRHAGPGAEIVALFGPRDLPVTIPTRRPVRF